jgi:hypothetical protein
MEIRVLHFLLTIPFGPDRIAIFTRPTVDLTDHVARSLSILSLVTCYLLHAGFLSDFFDPENVGDIFIQNVG